MVSFHLYPLQVLLGGYSGIKTMIEIKVNRCRQMFNRKAEGDRASLFNSRNSNSSSNSKTCFKK